MGTTLVRVPLRSVIVVEVFLAAGLMVWAGTGGRYGWAAPILTVLVSLGLVHSSGGRSLGARATEGLRFRWSRSQRDAADVAPPPFDMPAVHPTETGIGARWVGEELITVVRVAPGDIAPTFVTPGAAVIDEPGQAVPLDALADSLTAFDISLASIEVIGHGVRTWGVGPAAASYHRTLGPLPATAQRSVLVIIRLAPMRCADAVARRGGGTLGALRTASITTRRVANRLTENGLRVSILSATQIATVTGHLAEGAPLDDLDEHRDSIATRALRFRSAAIDPAQIGAVLSSVWVNDALSTTVTLRLRRAATGDLEVGGLVRFAELPAAGRVAHSWPSGLIPVRGHQFDALSASLPIAAPTRLHRQLPVLRGDDAQDLVRRMVVPAGGCGQLLGADPRGRAVALPLFGFGVDSVVIAASMRLLAQVTLRAVAIGASVTVHTTRPAQWRGLVAAVGDPRLLAVSADRIPAGMGHRVLIFDGVPTPPPQPHTTQFTVRAPGLPASGMPADATVLIEQNPRAPREILLTTRTHICSVTMVATADEWDVVGG
ncbi:type VII secretion protein EccE [Gordonia sp. CPCC 205515]|uniref:type VII secretion protein EccE n=1 Tax=Gordonia sp. CPCC 205515 TaxID=3140791 RepID=UPI003AF338AE